MNTDFLTLGVKKNTGGISVVALELTSQNIVVLDIGSMNDLQLSSVTQWQIGYITSCHDIQSYSSKMGLKHKPIGNELINTTRNKGRFILDAKASYPSKSLYSDKYQFTIIKVDKLKRIYVNADEFMIEASFERVVDALTIKVSDLKWIRYWNNYNNEEFDKKVECLTSYVNRYERQLYLVVEKKNVLECISLILY